LRYARLLLCASLAHSQKNTDRCYRLIRSTPNSMIFRFSNLVTDLYLEPVALLYSHSKLARITPPVSPSLVDTQVRVHPLLRADVWDHPAGKLIARIPPKLPLDH